MELIKKRDYIEKRAAYVKKLSDNYQTSLLYTNFRKEIETTRKKLEKNSALQNYFNYNHLFKLKKILEKEEKVLNHWLEKLLKGQKEYYELV
jgi:hypothetical protein